MLPLASLNGNLFKTTERIFSVKDWILACVWMTWLGSFLQVAHDTRLLLSNSRRFIPSEKIGQNFWPPWNGFFGINYHYWTWGNAFWPFLAPPDPWGGSRGVWGGQGGSRGPKIVTFLGATFGLQIGKFWIVWTENTLFSRFLAKNGPSGDQKWSFLGWNGWTQKCIFLKNTLFKLPENAP